MKSIYLDSHATTPLDPRVLEAMLPFLTEQFGNAASMTHAFGRAAAEAVERARAQVAAAVGAEPEEVVFTSGATEAINLALKGLAEARGSGRLVTATTEHPATLDTCARLERRGFAIARLPVEPDGSLPVERVAAALDDDTIAVSLMHANNEIGVVHDIAALGALCTARGVPLHVDATQSVGKIPVRMAEWGVRLLSLSGHKVYGPKGVGALVVRHGKPRLRLRAQIDGGGHERGMRSGTLNVPGVVGLGCALELAVAEMDGEAARLAGLRDRLRARLFGALDALEENGTAANKLPHNLNVVFRYVDSVGLLNAVPELAVSTGSACSSAEPAPSHVLLALGRDESEARSSVRFGLHRFTTAEEIDRAADLVIAAVRQLRTQSGLYMAGHEYHESDRRDG
jgi:cysteine desulfurase